MPLPILKQLIPSEVCLRCDVCCRFPDKETPWAPLCTESEVAFLIENKHATEKTFTNKGTKSACHIRLVPYKDYYACPYFTATDHVCTIYPSRPFECQLYPFLLVKEGGEFFIGLDTQCPYFKNQEKTEREHSITLLQGIFLRPDLQFFLKNNLSLFTEYSSADIDILFPLHLD